MKRRNFLSLLGLAPASYALPVKQEKPPVANLAWKDAPFEERLEAHPDVVAQLTNADLDRIYGILIREGASAPAINPNGHPVFPLYFSHG